MAGALDKGHAMNVKVDTWASVSSSSLGKHPSKRQSGKTIWQQIWQSKGTYYPVLGSVPSAIRAHFLIVSPQVCLRCTLYGMYSSPQECVAVLFQWTWYFQIWRNILCSLLSMGLSFLSLILQLNSSYLPIHLLLKFFFIFKIFYSSDLQSCL